MVGIKKMRAEISFKMRVVRPSETVWSSSYELFCVGGKKYLLQLDLSNFMVWSWIYDRFCHSHGTILDVFWGNVGLETCLGGSFLVRSRFNHFDSPHFGRFWDPHGKVFGDILVSFVDVNFMMDFYMIFEWILMDLDSLWTSKSEQIQWEVVQKSNFRIVCYRMWLGIDFGRILGLGWKDF